MKWLRNILKGLSLTSVLFVFQACYGTPVATDEDFLEESLVETSVAEEPEAEAETPEEAVELP